MFCFATIYTFRLWVENTVSFFRELQRSENPYSKDLGMLPLERQQSKTLRAQKKETKQSEDVFTCSTETMLDENKAYGIKQKTKEMRMK